MGKSIPEVVKTARENIDKMRTGFFIGKMITQKE